MKRREPKIEVLTIPGCPHARSAVDLVEQVVAELGLRPEIAHVSVPDAETAERLRFLGSPSIRVDGRDVEPGAAERQGFACACRLYRTETGLSGLPQRRWVAAALRRQENQKHPDGKSLITLATARPVA